MAALRAELDRRLATLQRKREDLKQQLSKLDEEIAWCDGEFAAASDRRKGRAAGRKRAKNQVNLVQALEQVLKRRTLSVTDMSEAVQKAGYRTTSPNFRTIVNQTLINNPQLFKRVARGKYTLAGRKGLRD